jgi:hypothetical protein
MLAQFVRSPNLVPQMQKFFQGNASKLVFEKTATDRGVYKFMMAGTTLTIGLVFTGIGRMATGTGKKPPRM